MASLPFTGADGLALHRHDWRRADPVGTVLLVHGLGEHAGRYAHVAAFLVGRGFDVVGYDQRGHGLSGGARGAIPHRHMLLWDLSAVLAQLRAEHSERPLVVFGHSMGGLVAARFVGESVQALPSSWSQPVDALVLSSPAFALHLALPRRIATRVLATLLPNQALPNGLEPAWISRDPAVVAAYVADPLVHDRITPRLARFIVEEGRAVRALAADWRTPTALFWAGADRCVAPSGCAAFAAAAPPGTVHAEAFAPLAHEIFNEPERATVCASLGAWLDTLPVRSRSRGTP